MLKHLLFLACCVVGNAWSQQTTLQVIGKDLTAINGESIVLRGVNYPFINQGDISLDDAAGYQHYIDEVAATGANAVRIPWYTSGQNWRDIPGPQTNGTPGTVDGYVTNGHLSNIIAYCISKQLVPILSIHDDDYITCKDNWAYFNSTVMDFWTSQEVLNLIETNRSQLIINLANEFDYVRWGGNQASELNTFKTNYLAAVSTLRNAGVNVPIMIDAPDCGQSSTELLSVAEEMNTADSRHNLIFSSHAYWYGYANSLSQVQTKLNEAAATNVCFVLGEVATNQDGDNPGECGFYNLATLYPQILTEACSRNIGWLAWTFNFDCSSDRQMSATSSSSNLGVFGNDIVFNTNYGLKSTNGCGAVLPSGNTNAISTTGLNDVQISPNPANTFLQVDAPFENIQLAIVDLQGKTIFQTVHQLHSTIDVSTFQQGVYVITLKSGLGNYQTKLIIE